MNKSIIIAALLISFSIIISPIAIHKYKMNECLKSDYQTYDLCITVVSAK